MARTRPPAVAGTFYPASRDELRRMVAELVAAAARDLTAAAPRDDAAIPKALIAPHAGYVYSGPIAASAYARVAAGRGIRRVVLIGPTHFAFVAGLALPSHDAFATPLGEVPIDRDAMSALGALPFVAVDDRAHAREHCLEVQLPFLQVVLGEFAVAPALVGEAPAEEVADALDAVWGGPETLVVVSSDLSHYEDYAAARRLDAVTAKIIERQAANELDTHCACGCRAIAGLLVAAHRRGLATRTLDLRSSGDTAGGRDAVVGYGAWAFA